jgi:hypothetical protein
VLLFLLRVVRRLGASLLLPHGSVLSDVFYAFATMKMKHHGVEGRREKRSKDQMRTPSLPSHFKEILIFL